jgi:hypothetical protein
VGGGGPVGKLEVGGEEWKGIGRGIYQAEAGVIRLSENGVGWIEDELGEENLVFAFVYLEWRLAIGASI